MVKLKVYYSISNGGDGSAYPHFSLDERLVDIHQKLVNMGEGWGEDCTGFLELESSTLINLVGKYNLSRDSLLEDVNYMLESKYTDKEFISELKEYKEELEAK